MRVEGKVIVVTGGGSGIGRQLVLELLRRKARVAAVDIDEAGLTGTAALATAGDSLATFVVDVADRVAVERLADSTATRFGCVDGIINCAGIIQPFVRLQDLEYQTIDRVLAVNLSGTVFMTKTFLPRLLERPEGHIVNVGSMGGFVPFPGQSMYGASKAAVKLLTEALHSELAETRVRVTLVLPGAVATNIKKNSGLEVSSAGAEKGRAYPADKAAREVVDGIERNRYRVLVGRDAKLLDVLCRLDPRRAAALIQRAMKRHVPK
ncbi:MAG: SDR family oxidoreductase [Myxococcales bacterium]